MTEPRAFWKCAVPEHTLSRKMKPPASYSVCRRRLSLAVQQWKSCVWKRSRKQRSGRRLLALEMSQGHLLLAENASCAYTAVQWGPADLVIQVHELFQQADKYLLLFGVERAQQAAREDMAGGEQFVHQRLPLRSEVKQAEAFALHRHHADDQPTLFEPNRQVGSRRGIERTKPCQRHLVDSRVIAQNA